MALVLLIDGYNVVAPIAPAGRRVELRGDFTVRIGMRAATIEAAGGRVVLTTSQTFSPAERDGSGDRRRLGLRLFALDLTPGLPAGAPEQISGQNKSDLR